MTRCRALAATFLFALLVWGCAAPAGVLAPRMPGWERDLALEWTAARRQGQPVIVGHLTNRSNFAVGEVRLLVDALAADGRVTGQRVSWLGRAVTVGTRTYFEVPAPPPAQTYRVSVYSYRILFDDVR